MLKTYTLKNGIKVATYSIPQMRSLFINETVLGGSYFDTNPKKGLAHFLEHLLVQGTPSYPNVEALSDFTESIAGRYGASTSYDKINFHINGPAKFADEMIKISSEVFFQPLLNEEDIEKERKVILDENSQRQDQLWYKNSKFFKEIRFKKNHPIILDIGGSNDTVKKITKKDLLDYWSKFFLPNNTYLVMVGGITNDELKNLIEKYYTSYKKGQNIVDFSHLTNQELTKRSVAIRNDQTLQSFYVTLSFPSIKENDPFLDRVAHGSLRNIFGGLRSSRLFRLLRQRRGLVYDVGFGSATSQYYGYSYASCQVLPENLDEVLELIIKELLIFKKNGPTENEVSNSKNYSSNQALMSFDHPSSIGGWIEGDLLWEDKIYMPEEYIKIIDKVDKQKIIDLMQKFWDFSKLNLVIQGPLEDSKANIKKYEKMIVEIK